MQRAALPGIKQSSNHLQMFGIKCIHIERARSLQLELMAVMMRNNHAREGLLLTVLDEGYKHDGDNGC